MDSLQPLTLAHIPPRDPDAHKGTFGTVLVVAGSRAYPGAAVLAALGAGRAGAGLVQIALPAGIEASVVPAVPFATILTVPATAGGGLASAAADRIVEASHRASSAVIGPGLDTDEDTGALVGELLRRLAIPVVLDADGLNHVARRELVDLTERQGATVLTPHPGEMGRLMHGPPPRGDAERREAAADLARRTGAVVVLKGHRTVVTDGRRVWIESAGNPGLATGGTGDVLAGALGALLGVLTGPAETAALAVHLHALAGDLAAAELGEEAVLPPDVAERLGRVMRPFKEHPRGS